MHYLKNKNKRKAYNNQYQKKFKKQSQKRKLLSKKKDKRKAFSANPWKDSKHVDHYCFFERTGIDLPPQSQEVKQGRGDPSRDADFTV